MRSEEKNSEQRQEIAALCVIVQQRVFLQSGSIACEQAS